MPVDRKTGGLGIASKQEVSLIATQFRWGVRTATWHEGVNAAYSHSISGGISLLVKVRHAASLVAQPVGLQELQHHEVASPHQRCCIQSETQDLSMTISRSLLMIAEAFR